MTLTLFNHETLSVSESRNQSSQFAHTYGGTAAAHGIRVKKVKAPFHLLFDLDLNDPAIDVSIPGVSRLPLLYGLHYAGTTGDQRYIVHSDRSVDVFGLKGHSPDYALEVPDAFTEAPISFEKIAFDPTKAEDALSYLQVFGLDHLSDSELERAISMAYDKWWGLDVHEDWSIYKDLSKREYLEFWGSPPFAQPGGVWDRCSNPKCDSVPKKISAARRVVRRLLGQGIGREVSEGFQQSSLRVIAMYEFKEYLVIYSYCHLCHSIHARDQAS